MRRIHLAVVLLAATGAYGANCGAELPERELPAEGEGEGAAEGEGEGAAEGEGEGAAEGEGEGPAEGEGEGPAEGEGEESPPLDVRVRIEPRPGQPEVAPDVLVAFLWVDPTQPGGGPDGMPLANSDRVLVTHPVGMVRRGRDAEVSVVLPPPEDDHLGPPPPDLLPGDTAGQVDVRTAFFTPVLYMDVDHDNELGVADAPLGWDLAHLLAYVEGELPEDRPPPFDEIGEGWNNIHLGGPSLEDLRVLDWSETVAVPIQVLPSFELGVALIADAGPQGSRWPGPLTRPRVILMTVGDAGQAGHVVETLEVGRLAPEGLTHLEMGLPDLRDARFDDLFRQHREDGAPYGEPGPLVLATFLLWEDANDNWVPDLGPPDQELCLAVQYERWLMFVRPGLPEAFFHIGVTQGWVPVVPHWDQFGGEDGGFPFDPDPSNDTFVLAWEDGEGCAMPDIGPKPPRVLVDCTGDEGVPALPAPRAYGDATVWNGDVYYVGGRSPDNYAEGSVFVLKRPERPEHQPAWQEADWRLATARSHLGVAALDDLLIAAGGLDGTEDRVNEFSGHARDGREVVRGNLPRPTSHLSGAVVGVGDRVVLFGGATDDGGVDRAVIRTHGADGDEWSRSGSFGLGTHDMAAAVHDGRVYGFGGILADGNQGGVVADTLRLEEDWDGWERLPDVEPEGRAGARAVTIGDAIYLLGGRTSPNGPPEGNVLRFTPADETWEELGNTGVIFREGMAAVARGQDILLLGGIEPQAGAGGPAFLDEVRVLCLEDEEGGGGDDPWSGEGGSGRN